MANDYFNHVANRVQAGTRAIAANVNAVADEISVGLDLLPTEDELKLGLTRYAVDSGVADAYVLTMPYVPVLTDGFNLTFKAVNANTGAATLNVNGTGIKSIVNPDGSALIANTFSANAIIIVAYESIGDRYILVSQNPAQSALAQVSAIAADASAIAAALSESNAATSESNASTSAGNASTSESNAATSESNAATSESNAATEVTYAAEWANKAEDSLISVAAGGDNVDDYSALHWNAKALGQLQLFEQSYLGAYASDPTLDNEGNALIDGALYFNTTSNQMNVYDLGGVTWNPFQDGGNAATIALTDESVDTTCFVAFAVDATGAQALRTGTNLTFDSAAGNLAATTFTGALAGNASTATTAGTVTTAAQPNITSVGTLTGLAVTGTGADVVNAQANATTATAIRAYSNTASRTVPVLEVINDNVTGAGTALKIQQDQAGYALEIDQNSAAAVINATAAGSGISMTMEGTTGNALFAYSNVASRTSPLIAVSNDNATGTGDAMTIVNDQSGDALSVVNTNAAGRALDISSAVASRTVPLVNINNTNAVGAGIGMSIINYQSGDALFVESEHVNGRAGHFYANDLNRTSPLVTMHSDQAGTGDYVLEVIQDGNAAGIQVNNNGSNYGINIDVSGTSANGILITGTTLTSGNYMKISHNTSSGGLGLLEIEQLNAGASVPLLLLDNDGTGPSISMETSGQIKFPATQVPSADVNTLDDYEEGTWTPTLWDTTESDAEGQTYTTQTGTYTKIGNRVFFELQLIVSSVGTLTGGDSVYIGGLPFTCQSVGAAVTASASGFAITAGNAVVGNLVPTANSISLEVYDATTGTTNMTVTQFSGNGALSMSGHYKV